MTAKMNNSWDIYPRPELGSVKKPVALTAATGLALSVWNHLEYSLSHLFHALSGCTNRFAFATFSVVEGSSVRVKMLQAASEAILNIEDELYSSVLDLSKKISQFRVASVNEVDFRGGIGAAMGQAACGGRGMVSSTRVGARPAMPSTCM